MIKQIIKTKKLLFGLLFLAIPFSLYAGNIPVHAEAINQCRLAQQGDEGSYAVDSACYYDLGICSTTTTGSINNFCIGLAGCDSNNNVTADQKSACDSDTIEVACSNSAYGNFISGACSELDSLCQSSSIASSLTSTCSNYSIIEKGSPNTATTCYDQYTQWTYSCGTGAKPAYNTSTTDPIVDSNNNIENPNGESFTFNVNDCYAAETVTPSGYVTSSGSVKPLSPPTTVVAWVQQSSTTCDGAAYSVSAAAAEGYPLLPNLSDSPTGSMSDNNSYNKCQSNCIVRDYINPLIRFLNIAVSLVVVIAVVVGGIQYSTSRDDPEAVKSAKKHILNALIGLVAYFLLYAFLNFIIPGGA